MFLFQERFFRTAGADESSASSTAGIANSHQGSTPNATPATPVHGLGSCPTPINSTLSAPLAIISANIRGLITSKGKFKLPMLYEKAIDENVGIISLTESHLNDSHLEGEININGYVPYRSDRAAGIRKGGVITYIRRDLIPGARKIEAGSLGNIEYLTIDIPEINSVLITIYRPPTALLTNFKKVLSNIQKAIDSYSGILPRILLTGDLNFPTLDWKTSTVGSSSADEKEQALLLLEFFNKFFMEQYVDEPTRLNNILDIFAINDHEVVDHIIVEPMDNRTSDHKLIIVKTCLMSNSNSNKSCHEDNSSGLDKLNFWSPRTNWDQIKAELMNVNWTECSEEENVDDMNLFFLNTVLDICKKHVPEKVKKNRNIIPSDRRSLMKKRKIIRSKFLRTTNIQQLLSVEHRLLQIEQDIIESHNTQMSHDEAMAIMKINENPKYFYNYARAKSQTKAPVGPLVVDKTTIADPAGMCEQLKLQFESVYSNPSGQIDIEDLLTVPGPRGLESIEFTEDDIATSILQLTANSSPGLDGVPALLLRNCVQELKKPIYNLWKLSMKVGKLPSMMKLSVVIPVFKGGSRSDAGNYRPISLTSHICKVFERIIVNHLTSYFNKASLYNQRQHGFRGGRSCLSQLLDHQQRVLDALENNAGVDVVYLDFAKAFDKVDHKILICKLKSIGVGGQLLRWIADFVSNRHQKVRVEGEVSSKGSVQSGVPQGSALGPLLFLVLIADIDRSLQYATASSFADDTRLFLKVLNDIDCFRMQEDLISVYEWANDNNMMFNGTKFELVCYSARSRNLFEINDQYRLFNYPNYFDVWGNLIKTMPSVRDLGITIECNASFQTHINNVVSKGRRQAGWVLRVFETRDLKPLLVLYRALVLPHLEYCCQLWSPAPTALGKIRQLESIQRSFTSRIRGVGTMNYWQRLKHLQLYSLERRRERYMIIYVFKIITGIVPNIENDKFQLKITQNARLGRKCIIPSINTVSPASVASIVESSFPVRGPRLFNALPPDLRNFNGSTLSFKAKVDKFLLNVPDQPCMPGYQQAAPTNSIIDQLRILRGAGVFH